MKNNSKRICALLLAIVMCIGCVVPVFAETTVAPHDHSVAAEAKCPGYEADGKTPKEHTTANSTYAPVLGDDGKPVVVAPQCGEWGYTLNRCTTCNAPVLTDWVPPLGGSEHPWGEWTVDKAPTCFEYGVMYRECTTDGCPGRVEINANNYAEMTAKYGADVTKAIKPREHVLANDKPAGLTCQDTATWNVWCTYEDCTHGKLASGEVDTAWNDGIDGKVDGKPCTREVVDITLAPDCYTNGKATVKCSVCGDTDTEVVVEATQGGAGHSWVKLSITEAATCGKAASGTAKCSVCGKIADVVEGVVTIKAEVAGTSADVKITVAGFEKLAHDFSGEIVKGSDASCKDTGIRDHYVCKNGCGAISLNKTDVCTQADLVIGKVAHTWGALVEKTEATCTVSGKKAHKVCSVCAAYLDVDATTAAGKEVVVAEADLVIAPAHDYGTIELDANGAPTNKPKLNSESSCYEYGFWVYTCRKCGKPADTSVETDLPHGAAGWVSSGVYRLALLEHTLKTTEGSCTEDHVEECTVPGCGYKKTTDAPGHTLATVKVAATCHTDGYWFDYCTVCGLKDTANDDGIVELDECVYVRIETTEPTESGKAKTDASGRYEISPMNPANHDWDEMQTRITTAPTCVSDGMALKYCPWCDERMDVPLPALGHDVDKVNYKEACYKDEEDPTCTQDGYYIYGCSRCDDKDQKFEIKASALPTTHAKYSATAHNALDHKFVLDSTATDYVAPANTPATCYSSGYDLYTCVRCNNKEAGGTKMVDEKDNGDKLYPKLNHKYADGTSAITRKEYDPKCKPTVVGGVIKLTGENGYVIDTCALCAAEKANNANYQTDYPLTITYEELLAAATTEAERNYAAKFLFSWNNKEHHPNADVNPNTFYHYDAATDTYYVFGTFDADGNLTGDEAARKDFMTANSLTALNGIIRVGKCDVSSIVDYYCPTCKYTFHHIDDTMVGKHVVLSGSEAGPQDPTCTTIGKYAHYKCSVCECDVRITFDVNGKEVHTVYDLAKNPGALDIAALGHDWVEKAGVTPDCVNGGSKKYYDCSRCDLYTLDKDAATVVTFDSAKFDENVKLPANGHSFTDFHEMVPATCTEDGKKAYFDCVKCDAYSINGTDATTESLKIAHDGHAWVEGDVLGKTLSKADCVTEGYRYDYCSKCDAEKVVNYVYPYGHKFGDIVNKVDPDCNDTGFEAYYKCSECNEKFTSNSDLYSTDFKTDVQLTIPATGLHKNKGGETIRNTCTDTVTDRFCTGCNQTIAKEHANKKYNTVDATCTEYGYTAFDCIDCGEHGREPGTPVIEPTNPGHEKKDVPTYCYWDTTTKPAGMYTPGEKYLKCNVCDTILETVPTEPLGGIKFSYELDNAIVSGAEYVNGGKIKLTIKYTAAKVDLASINIRLDYDDTVLKFADGDFKEVVDANGAKIFELSNAYIRGNDNINDGKPGYMVLSAATTAFGAAPANKTLDGEGVLAIVYFDILPTVDDGASNIWFKINMNATIGESKVLDAEFNEIEANFGAEDQGIVAEAANKSLVDIDNDNKYNSADILEFLAAVQAYMANGTYDAVADVDQDGRITANDYALLRDVCLGTLKYEDACKYAQSGLVYEG